MQNDCSEVRVVAAFAAEKFSYYFALFCGGQALR